MKHISSLQNKLVKEVVALRTKAKARKEKGHFIVEGQRELQLALQAGFEAETIFWCAEIFSIEAFQKWQSTLHKKIECIQVSLEVYHKIGVRESTEGVVGIVAQKNGDLYIHTYRHKEDTGNCKIPFRDGNGSSNRCHNTIPNSGVPTFFDQPSHFKESKH